MNKFITFILLFLIIEEIIAYNQTSTLKLLNRSHFAYIYSRHLSDNYLKWFLNIS